MRNFNSGATRDDNTGKLDYVRGLSAQVNQRYLEYLGSHRRQKDGSLRDWDNWKRGIPPETYRESLLRHTNDAVRASMGLPVPENASLEDLLCAIRFNADGWLFELLAARSGNRELEDAPSAQPICGNCAHYADECGPEATTTPADSADSACSCFTPKGGA